MIGFINNLDPYCEPRIRIQPEVENDELYMLIYNCLKPNNKVISDSVCHA